MSNLLAVLALVVSVAIGISFALTFALTVRDSLKELLSDIYDSQKEKQKNDDGEYISFDEMLQTSKRKRDENWGVYIQRLRSRLHGGGVDVQEIASGLSHEDAEKIFRAACLNRRDGDSGYLAGDTGGNRWIFLTPHERLELRRADNYSGPPNNLAVWAPGVQMPAQTDEIDLKQKRVGQ